MASLTLTQVREAGRFAWHEDGLLIYAPGWRLQVLWVPRQRGGDYSYNTGGGEPYTGWHHLLGCDCPHCS